MGMLFFLPPEITKAEVCALDFNPFIFSVKLADFFDVFEVYGAIFF